MFSDIRHSDGSYEFRLHVSPDRLDPTTAAEALSVLRGLVRELEPFVEPGAVPRVLPIEISRVDRLPGLLTRTGSETPAGAGSPLRSADEAASEGRVSALAAPPP